MERERDPKCRGFWYRFLKDELIENPLHSNTKIVLNKELGTIGIDESNDNAIQIFLSDGLIRRLLEDHGGLYGKRNSNSIRSLPVRTPAINCFCLWRFDFGNT
jgi:hypothetical protein